MKTSKQGDWGTVDAIRAQSGVMTHSDPGFTVEEYAARYGMRHATAETQLSRLVEAGLLIKGRRSIKNGISGVMRHRVVYQPVKKAVAR